MSQASTDDRLQTLTHRVNFLERDFVRLQAHLAKSDPAYANSLRNTCVSNLMQIYSAKKQWAIVEKKAESDTPTPADLVGTPRAGYVKTYPQCPMGGEYSIHPVGALPTCTLADLGHKLTPRS